MAERMGRKPKYSDEELIERLVAALRAGNYVETACAYAGIGTSTYYRWLQEAEKDDAPDYLRDLRDAVESARAAAIVRNVKLIQDAAANGSWQAAAWWLERSQPHMWGRNDKLRTEISGPDGGPVTVMSAAEARRALLDMLEETDGPVAE